MPSTIHQERGRQRSLSWPQPIRLPTEGHKGKPDSMYATVTESPSHGFYADHEFDEYPDRIFSSPVKMYEYDDWASDSDDDEEEVQWDAGITDFALFDHDRRKAHEKNEPVPERWSGMVQNQASALERSVLRSNTDSTTAPNDRLRRDVDDMPSLTPDQSPDLRDDLDSEPYRGRMAAGPSVQWYFTEERSPSDQLRKDEPRNHHKPMKFSTPDSRQRTQSSSPPVRRQQRPGLSHSRTMSGHIHSWRRPDKKMYTVGEEPQAETEEDECATRRIDSFVGHRCGRSQSYRKV